MAQSCLLCSLGLPKNPVVDEGKFFCCSGCLMVFKIIGEKENYKNHPLFLEALKAGVISQPFLQEQTKDWVASGEKIKFHLQIDGMWCPSCADAIQLILMKQKGILNCVVDYTTDLAVVTFDPYILDKEKVITQIKKLGYQASEFFSQEKNKVSRTLWLRLALAVFCAMNIMMLSYPLYAAHFGISTEGYDQSLAWLSFALALPLVSYCAWPIWKRLMVSFKAGLFGMETLVFLGVTTAFTLSTYNLVHHDTSHLYFDSMSMVLSFVLLGKILERKAKFSAKQTSLRLIRSLPKKGCKRTESGKYEYVPLKEIVCGDRLLVRTGEKIVLDGVIEEGSGCVDEAVMTGEVYPQQKTVGNQVLAGSIVKNGSFTYCVTKDQDHSLLGQIVSLIENDLRHKTASDRFVTTITRFFIPTVLCLALLTFFMSGTARALTLLLISCPCALGIAVPLVQSRLLYCFAEKGALVRNRSRLHLLGQNPFFVFDKTGTLTEGKFRILNPIHLSQEDSAILKTLASHSHHPISFAIATSLFSKEITLESVKEVVGRGMEGSYQGNNYLLGSDCFLKERGVKVPESRTHLDTTVVYFAKETTLLAEIHLGDRLRNRLPKVEAGVLSGDCQNLVSHIAKKCGFLWGKGRMDPLQKREEMMRLKQSGRPIVMVGDGVNDAAAMTAADLGISVVSASDIAVEVSDILLTTEHLDELPALCKLVKKSKKIIYQNLFWAFFYNSIGIVLAFFGLLTPLFAAIAMAVSSLFVTVNSLRIR